MPWHDIWHLTFTRSTDISQDLLRSHKIYWDLTRSTEISQDLLRSQKIYWYLTNWDLTRSARIPLIPTHKKNSVHFLPHPYKPLQDHCQPMKPYIFWQLMSHTEIRGITMTNTHTKKKTKTQEIPVLMYIGFNALLLMSTVHLKTKTQMLRFDYCVKQKLRCHIFETRKRSTMWKVKVNV